MNIIKVRYGFFPNPADIWKYRNCTGLQYENILSKTYKYKISFSSDWSCYKKGEIKIKK